MNKFQMMLGLYLEKDYSNNLSIMMLDVYQFIYEITDKDPRRREVILDDMRHFSAKDKTEGKEINWLPELQIILTRCRQKSKNTQLSELDEHSSKRHQEIINFIDLFKYVLMNGAN